MYLILHAASMVSIVLLWVAPLRLSPLVEPANSHHQVYLPLVAKSPVAVAIGIYGRVTARGASAAGISLTIYRCDDENGCEDAGTTRTDSDGRYSFRGLPSLTTGQTYYVEFLNGPDGNNPENPNHLLFWASFDITTYTAGSNVPGGDFDIAEIQMLAPDDGARTSLPTTFTWTNRGIASDRYLWGMFALDGSSSCMQADFGTNTSFTLTSAGFAECELKFNTEYRWFIFVTTDANENSGFGASHAARSVTFVRTSGTSQIEASGDAVVKSRALPRGRMPRVPSARP